MGSDIDRPGAHLIRVSIGNARQAGDDEIGQRQRQIRQQFRLAPGLETVDQSIDLCLDPGLRPRHGLAGETFQMHMPQRLVKGRVGRSEHLRHLLPGVEVVVVAAGKMLPVEQHGFHVPVTGYDKKPRRQFMDRPVLAELPIHSRHVAPWRAVKGIEGSGRYTGHGVLPPLLDFVLCHRNYTATTAPVGTAWAPCLDCFCASHRAAHCRVAAATIAGPDRSPAQYSKKSFPNPRRAYPGHPRSHGS